MGDALSYQTELINRLHNTLQSATALTTLPPTTMEVTHTRRSARIAALQKKKEEEARNDASTTTNPKILPKKAQASKKGNARKPKKKAQAPPKNVHTPTQKKAQASNDGIGQLHDDNDD